MAFIVEMARGEPYTPAYAGFSVHAETWKGLLALAETFGWRPAGTVPDARFLKRSPDTYRAAFQPNYHPEEWQFAKRITDDDAREISDALRRAIAAIRAGKVALLERPGPYLIKDDMTEAELRAANALPSELVDGFASFAAGGGFAFAWDD